VNGRKAAELGHFSFCSAPAMQPPPPSARGTTPRPGERRCPGAAQSGGRDLQFAVIRASRPRTRMGCSEIQGAVVEEAAVILGAKTFTTFPPPCPRDVTKSAGRSPISRRGLPAGGDGAAAASLARARRYTRLGAHARAQVSGARAPRRRPSPRRSHSCIKWSRQWSLSPVHALVSSSPALQLPAEIRDFSMVGAV
jgi:hypothetical protein